MTRCRIALALAAFLLIGTARAQENPPLFTDGQKVVFYGDSITHGGWYEYYLQLFYATRFPERKIFIYNAGISGATSGGSLSRLDEDVLARKPDVVYVMFGMNDVGRNNYKSAEADEKTLATRQGSLDWYRKSQAETVKRLKAGGAAVVIVTPTPYDQYSTSAQAENLAVCNDGLAKCAQIARELAAAEHCPVADLHEKITALMVKNPELKFVGNDRVHPGQMGHMLMAYFLLQAQQAPALVAKAELDFAQKTTVAAENCRISDLAVEGKKLKFTYLAQALPFPDSKEYQEAAQLVPWESLNQELFVVRNLPAGEHKLRIGGEEVGKFSTEQFAAGVNLAGLKTPQQKKAQQLRAAVMAQAGAERPLRTLVQGDGMLRAKKIDPADVAASDKALDEQLEKTSQQYRAYFTGVVKNYRECRGRREELVQKAQAALAEVHRLQGTEAYPVEIGD